MPRPLLRPPLLLAVHCVLLPALVTLHTQMACDKNILLAQKIFVCSPWPLLSSPAAVMAAGVGELDCEAGESGVPGDGRMVSPWPG